MLSLCFYKKSAVKTGFLNHLTQLLFFHVQMNQLSSRETARFRNWMNIYAFINFYMTSNFVSSYR